MASFPMIEHDYKPWASLGALYQGQNAGNAGVMQNLDAISQAIENNLAPMKADTELMRAQAYRDQVAQSALDKKFTSEDRVAKAEELRKIMANRDAAGYIDTALSMQQTGAGDSNEMLDQLIAEGKLPASVVARLRPDPQTKLYTMDNLNRILQSIRETDPTASKVLNREVAEAGANQRNADSNATRERIASCRNENRAKIAQLKTAGEKISLENLAATYMKLAHQSTNPEEKLAYTQMANEAIEAASTVRAAPAVRGPGAKGDAAIKTLERLTGRNGSGSGGTIGGTPFKKPPPADGSAERPFVIN